ncbi:MAG: DUF4179 domain-containing protein [Clostridiales bacterium]|nr:DUF4179 domain-containing protein [Clostridiales bacterium]
MSKSRFSGAARIGAILAVLVVCFLVVTPALADGVSGAYELLYLVSPKAAQFFKPIRKSSIDQGIEVSLEGISIDGASASVLITIRDLIAERIDDSIDLYDSYEINVDFDNAGHCEQIGYDPETKTATFLITIESMQPGVTSITGKKLTFSLTTLLSGAKKAVAVPIEVDWSAISDKVETELSDPYDEIVMVPGRTLFSPYDGFDVTGIGYVNGKLHIQLCTLGRHLYDDHAFLYLQDESGHIVPGDPLYRGGYGANADATRRADYVEYAFDIQPDDLSSYSLFGDFYHASNRVDGYWSVTFSLENDDALQ